MANLLSPLRFALYLALSLFAIALLGLCAARIHHTIGLSRGSVLNGGVDFWDPIVVELLTTAILTMLWSWFIMHTIRKRRDSGFVSKFRDEIIGSTILWIMLLVGAAIATTTSNRPYGRKWGNLSACNGISINCRVLTALVAFAWINWITLTILLALAFAHAAANRSLRHPMHGHGDFNRDSRNNRAGPQMGARPTV